MPGFSKHAQLTKRYPLARDPAALRARLRRPMPRTLQESQAERYGWCAFPGCRVKGTPARPLEQHHILPRSQSKAGVDDFRNHLYLCGGWSGVDHHGGLHNRATPGRADWVRAGVLPARKWEPTLA